jgi:murein DD-endopeptidase MepM/ murein hydrolase activator NlpD
MLGGLAATNAVTLAGLMVTPDISRLWHNQPAIAAYETRLTQLRRDVDRLRSKEYASSGSPKLRLQDLAQLQLQLGEQLGTVRLLARKATELGADVYPASLSPPIQGDSALPSKAGQLDEVERGLRDIERETAVALTALTEVVTQSADAIAGELSRVGHAPSSNNLLAVGGALLQEDDDLFDTKFDAGPTIAAIDRLRMVRVAMDEVPIHRPVSTARTSSDYGFRKDPFTGQKAFHSGIDFPAPSGTPVTSAARGTVSFVGWKDGYGRVVEITHQSGLVSRYPHLSKALVAKGDEVEADAKIALVGSTGRSTGPHLHFELRQGDKAIDPAPFLTAGERLEPFDS